jgi:hypothetical protein
VIITADSIKIMEYGIFMTQQRIAVGWILLNSGQALSQGRLKHYHHFKLHIAGAALIE